MCHASVSAPMTFGRVNLRKSGVYSEHCMELSPRSQRLFRVALLGTMATPLVLVLVSLIRNPASCRTPRSHFWLGAYALFGLAFWLTAKRGKRLPRLWLAASLAFQSALVLVMVNSICNGYEGALLVVVAGQLAPLFSLPLSLGWVAGQSLLMGFVIHSHFSLEIALALSASWFGFQIFTVLMSQAATRFFFNDAATTEIYTLSLHDALPIYATGMETQAKFADTIYSRDTGGLYVN